MGSGLDFNLKEMTRLPKHTEVISKASYHSLKVSGKRNETLKFRTQYTMKTNSYADDFLSFLNAKKAENIATIKKCLVCQESVIWIFNGNALRDRIYSGST
jgi:hypothetical protein